MQFISCGLARLASKMASTNQSSEAALEENTLYVQLAHLQNSLLIKSREWPLQMQPALQSMFDNNLSWRVDTK